MVRGEAGGGALPSSPFKRLREIRGEGIAPTSALLFQLHACARVNTALLFYSFFSFFVTDSCCAVR
jgi:hypothetical protein